jgi:Mrp family chromosome partitioning ATPase
MKLLRRYILWLTAATLAGIAGALLIHASLSAHYVSTAKVDVEPNIAALTIDYAPNMVTEQQVATSGVVLARTASALGTTASALAKDLSATVSGDSSTGGTANVLGISCQMPTAIGAQRCAAAAAAAYMGVRNDAGAPKATQAHNPLHVTLVTAATLPTAPSGVRLAILLPIGALLGLLLGIGAVFVRDYSDHRVRDREDLERCLAAPVLAAIPRAPHSRDIFRRRPLSQAAESYRYLREHLNPLISSVPGGGAVVLVVGAQADDGITSVAANLAAALAEPGARVLLVDADLWHPSLSAAFDVSHGAGWSDLLAGQASLDEVAVPVPRVSGLRLLSTGVVTAKSAEIFREARLSQVFLEMRAQADVVVVASAPVLEISHAIGLARVSDIVAMVADVRHTSREAVGAATREIRATGPRIIVGVLRGVTPAANRRLQPAPVPAGSMVSASEASAILAGVVPARGPNGQQRQQPGTGHAYRPARGGTETGEGNDPGSGEVNR